MKITVWSYVLCNLDSSAEGGGVGGLVLYWKEKMILKVETTSKNHIDCIIGKGSEGAWRFVGFLGEPNT